MSHSGKGTSAFVAAILVCSCFIATIGSAITSRQQDRQRLSASTSAVLSLESSPSPINAPHKSAASQAKSTNPPPPGVLAAPLFIADAEFSSGLGLVNGTGISTYADVILRALDGTTIAQRRITFPPRSLRRIDLAEFLKSSGATATAGSIVIIPSAELKGPAILSSLAITYTNSQEPSFIDEKLALPTSASSQTLRGVADKGEGSPLVALTSLANESQHVAIQCLGPHGLSFSKTVTLAAGQSILTEACSSRTSSVADLETPQQAGTEVSRPATGISLTSDGAPGSFAAFGLAPHQKSGSKFFSSVTFTDPKVWLSANSMFGGVPVGTTTELGGGNYVPALSLANFSSKAAHVTVQYAENSNGASSAHDIQSIAVPPGQTRDLVLDNLQGDPDLQNSFLVLSDASPGDLLTKLISVTSLRPGEVEMLGKDQLDRENVGTQPWSIEDGTESTLLLFNHSDKPQTFHVLISGGASLWQKDYELQSVETEGINIGDLIANKTKDDSGKTIPVDATSGEVTWVIGLHGVGRGRILQSNATTGMARSFSCGQYATIASANWNSLLSSVPDGTTVDIGGVVAVLDLVYPYYCTGSYAYTGNSSGFLYTYSSSNTSILTAQSFGSNYTVNAEGMADGTATMYGTVTDTETGCEGQTQDTQSVIPNITGPTTLWWFGGQNPNSSNYPVSITLSATGGSGTWSVTFGATRINLSTTTGTQTTLTPTGSHFSGAGGDTCLKYTVSGLPSHPFCLTVRTPWKLVPNLTNSGTESNSTYGYSTTIAYDVHDNLDTLIAQDVTWNEVVGTAQNLNGSNWATCCGPIQSGGGSTDPLTDILRPPSINSTPAPPSPTPTFHNPPSGTTIYRQISQPIKVGSGGTSGLGVLVQSDNLTYWIDHGSHENIVVPSQPPQ